MAEAYSKSQIQKMLDENDFEDQRVDLPYGLRTPGADRSATCDLVLPESLSGKTVLDVGAANGYFSFEAESRGASRVVGVELKAKRLEHAKLLKNRATVTES